MNRKIVAYFVGSVLRIEAMLMIVPTVVSILYREKEWIFLAVAVALSFLTGYLLSYKKPKNMTFYTREGITSVALGWILMSVFGAIPLWHAVPQIGFTDALFETISGFTTTGASILTEVESLPKGLLFWRSFTHWVGGMGILVFVLALLPEASGDSIYLMRAESPGPSVGKLVPKVKTTAKILYEIYIVITLVEIVVLKITGMSLYESSVLAFGTVGTGGFAIRDTGLVSITTVQQTVITVFMIICGANFNVYFLLVAKKFKEAFKSEEVLSYLAIYAFAVLAVAINIRNVFSTFGEALHHSFFNVASVMTTTGFASADFNTWPNFSRTMLLVVMFIGGCAGSTAGGIKVSRIVIGFKTIRKELQHFVHPRSVKILKFEGKPIEHAVLRGINVYFLTYITIFAVSVLLVALDGKDFTTTITSVIATFNNIGPGLDMVGPFGNYSQFSPFAKYVLMFDMLAGRLELFPMLLLFMPITWRRQR
ncbi:MAG: TrkH family potassium uptake protein [Lachnospiraceae bacterium]|nr:TrkH family potassium uptake protein [Lachnospiraceae bacterium]